MTPNPSSFSARKRAELSKMPAVLILAAGQGKRMKSSLPKVLHKVCGKSLISWILSETLKTFPKSPVGIVVGHQADQVRAAVLAEFGEFSEYIQFVEQKEQRGTGHAVQVAIQSEWGQKILQSSSHLIVLPGDLPLIRADLLSPLGAPLSKRESVRLLTCLMEQPYGYGRVVRRGGKEGVGDVFEIVEEKDATPKQKRIREVSTSIYNFDLKFLSQALKDLKPNNAQNEYYLTDVVGIARKKKKHTSALLWSRPEDLRGINDLWELSIAQAELNRRIVEMHAREGVRFEDPTHCRIEGEVRFGAGVVIHSGVIIRGKSNIGAGVELGPNVLIENSDVGENTFVKAGSVLIQSIVGADCQLGPYCHLRPNSRVGDHCKIGNFVELKETSIGDHTAVAHLSYLGDALVGQRVNIGCGFVTCNFDGVVRNGKKKHTTVIEDDVFMGSDCQTVAPVKIGKGSYVASGSTITENVEQEALAIARSRQVNKPGYARKLKSRRE